MKATNKTYLEFRRFASNMPTLQRIAKKLHHQDENACNYGLSERQEKEVEKMELRAEELAQEMGLHAYHQGDPRGGSLYLVNDEDLKSGQYYNGILIIHQ
jgi:hypothetical protein